MRVIDEDDLKELLASIRKSRPVVVRLAFLQRSVQLKEFLASPTHVTTDCRWRRLSELAGETTDSGNRPRPETRTAP